MKYKCDKCKKTIPSNEWVNVFNAGTNKEETLCEDCRRKSKLGSVK